MSSSKLSQRRPIVLTPQLERLPLSTLQKMGRGVPSRPAAPFQEAKTFWRNNPVVFGQYKKEQIEAELRKLRKAKRCQKETKNRQKPKDSEGRFGWPSVAPQPSAPGPESWATYSDKIPAEY